MLEVSDQRLRYDNDMDLPYNEWKFLKYKKYASIKNGLIFCEQYNIIQSG